MDVKHRQEQEQGKELSQNDGLLQSRGIVEATNPAAWASRTDASIEHERHPDIVLNLLRQTPEGYQPWNHGEEKRNRAKHMYKGFATTIPNE